MTTVDIKLMGREWVAEGTMAFHFTRPTGFDYKPGQAVDVILKNPRTADAQSGRHAFSLVSAPFQDELAVATRMRDSAFKRALQSLPIGEPVGIDGPFGSLTLHNNRTRPGVFVAGGIGITPFMSILRQAARDRLPHRLSLLYSNRRPEDAAFLAELQQLDQRLPNFRLVATMTQMSKSIRSWEGETRPIDEDLVTTECRELAAPICYLAGPPGMVAALRQTLNRAGIDDDDIRGEEFFGY